MKTYRKKILRYSATACLLALTSPLVLAVTDNQVFAWAAGAFPAYFSGAITAGQIQQFNYRLFAGTGNAVAVDSAGGLFVMGPATGNVLVSLGPTSAFDATIAAWEATQTGTQQMGGARQGVALNLTGTVTTFAGTGTAGLTNGAATMARLSRPYDVTTDGTSLFVADQQNHVIRQIDIATGAVSTLAGGNGQSIVPVCPACGATEGIGTLAAFNNPSGITTDGVNLYVADTGNNRIRKIVIATGLVSTLAGQGFAGTGSYEQDGVGKLAGFKNPTAITTDGTNLYVSDTQGNAVRKIVIATAAVSTLRSSDPQGPEAGPRGLTTDGTNLYVAYYSTQFIGKINLATGAFSALSGTPTIASSGSADGPAASAKFAKPEGITTDGVNLYVTESSSYKIRKVSIATGAASTLAGGNTQGSTDGVGAAASFYIPYGITTDGVSLFVADSQNHKIRRIK